jgi:Zn-dependent protease
MQDPQAPQPPLAPLDTGTGAVIVNTPEVPTPEMMHAELPVPSLPAQPGGRKRGGLGVVSALLLTALAKAKWLLIGLKALPIGKLLLTSASMIAMVAFEAARSGVWFGVGFVLMLLVHELGHGYAMKRCGVQAGWPIFIPFFGAMIAMKGLPRDRSHEAEIAYGGPLAGAVVAVLAVAVGVLTDSRIFMVLAYTAFFLNLFNLTPISPLDGGRITQAFSRRAWIVGAALLVIMFFTTHSPQLLLIALIALPRLFGRGTDDREKLEPAQQIAWAIRYFGLAAFLAVGMYYSGQLIGRG